MKNKLLPQYSFKAAPELGSGFMFYALFAVITVLFIPYDLCSQNPSSMIYHKDSLKADLVDLKNTLYASHQDPFYYVDSLEFEKAFNDAYEGLTQDTSLTAFSESVGLLLQKLRDSHTVVSYRSLFNYLRADTSLNYYFNTIVLDNKVIISKDHRHLIPDGAELVSINGTPSSQLIEDLRPYQILEGNSTEQSIRFSSGLIPRIAAMKYGVKKSNTLTYSIGSEIKEISYPGTTYKFIKKDKSVPRKDPYQLVINDSIAHLKIGSFSAKTDVHYQRFLQRSFRKIKRKECTHLVIDLRDNLGGSVWRMEELFTYLSGPDILAPYSIITTKSPLSQQKYDRLTKGVFGWCRMHLFKKNDKMRVFRELALMPEGANDTLVYQEYSEKKKLKFSGTPTLFINHASGSASVLFASAFQLNEFGKTYGTPCLGPFGGTWGDPTTYTLPRSYLKVNISVIKLATTKEYLKDPTSISPDVLVPITPEHYQSDTDHLYQFYVGEITKKRGN